MSAERLKAGVVLLRTGQFNSAEKFFRSCLEEEDSATAWFYLGVAQHGGGRLSLAAESLAKAIARSPQLTQAREARAAVLAALSRPAEAEAELRAAIAAGATGTQLSVNLAIVLEQRGAVNEALALYSDVLGSDPSHYAARLNRGALLLSLKRPHEALADFERLAESAPSRPEIHLNRARALFELHRDADGLAVADHVLRLDGANPRAWLDRIIALASLGRLEESSAALAQARKKGIALTAVPAGPRSVDDLDPTALYVDRALARQRACDWRDRRRLLATIRDDLANPGGGQLSRGGVLFHSQALPLSGHELKAIAARFAERIRNDAARLDVKEVLPAPSGKRVRVGFLSSGIRDHPEARLLWRIFEDRDHSRFEYLIYALNQDDGSAIRSALVRSADMFVDSSAWSSEQLVQRIRRDCLHLLIDLSGCLEGARPEVLAARVAPVQANLFGPACTLGPGLIDYRLSDAFATPPAAQPDWHERLVFLPAPHWTYDSQQVIGDAGSRQLHGLPHSGFVYCCFNQGFKICPEVFAVWMRLLCQTPGSVLWLADGGLLVRTNLAREASAAGVDPSRLVFGPHLDLPAHLGRQRHADLFLDTLHYGAHTTAADALHVGLPVLTCRGSTMASRLCAALVHGAGIPELVVDSLEDYERKALDLSRNAEMLAEVKARLAAARSTAPFFATRARVRAIERAFVAMTDRQRGGLPPETLVIDEG